MSSSQNDASTTSSPFAFGGNDQDIGRRVVHLEGSGPQFFAQGVLADTGEDKVINLAVEAMLLQIHRGGHHGGSKQIREYLVE